MYSLQQSAQYYEIMGETFERFAMIKARPIAGDLDLGRRFLDMFDRSFIASTLIMPRSKNSQGTKLGRTGSTPRSQRGIGTSRWDGAEYGRLSSSRRSSSSSTAAPKPSSRIPTRSRHLRRSSSRLYRRHEPARAPRRLRVSEKTRTPPPGGSRGTDPHALRRTCRAHGDRSAPRLRNGERAALHARDAPRQCARGVLRSV